MTRRTFLTVMMLAIILSLLVPVVPAAAKRATLAVSGTLSCPWVPLDAYAHTTGGGYRLTNYKMVCQATADDPMGAGTVIAMMNADLDTTFAGPVWGTYTRETAGRDGWQGSFTGQNTALTTVMLGTAKGVGAYAGLKMEETFNLIGDNNTYSGTFTMVITGNRLR